MNKTLLTGYISKDVELKTTQTGKSVATLNLAVRRPFSDETDFFKAVVWESKADNCAKYLKKGSKVGIVGYLYNRAYEDKEGIKRTSTEILVEDIEFLTKVEEKKEVVLEEVQIELPF